MIVGGYSLDLYCDDPKHKDRNPSQFNYLDAQFFSETARECLRAARLDGWVFRDKNTVAICPDCARASA